ncbi:MAG: 6-carboxytetrahydropterin synthase [Bacteroidales bacterium]|nr:6-carboxytetrahydropterin synthase [Bacteroidales bacterium]
MKEVRMNPSDQIVRVTKEFSFEMAHLLTEYDGLCRNIHGHSYKLAVTVSGPICQDVSSPKLGMVMDFSVLKKIVMEEVVDRLDHALVVRKGTRQAEALKGLAERIIEVEYQPTCENMVCHFAQLIMSRLPEDIKLRKIKLNETATSFAEWVDSDNTTLNSQSAAVTPKPLNYQK